MDNIPKEVILRHASREAGNYFSEKIEQERKEGKVAVLLKDFTNSLYFLPCDDNGYPNTYGAKVLHIPQIAPMPLMSDISQMATLDFTVEELILQVESPTSATP